MSFDDSKINLALAAWDGKSKEVIGDIFLAYKGYDEFSSYLIELLILKCAKGEPEYTNAIFFQKGATRLLKAWLESGERLTSKQTTLILSHLYLLSSWEAKLHILQSFPYFSIGEAQVKSVEAFIRDKLMDTNKFVRAWAYHGFYELAKQYPHYQEEAKCFFEQALIDEPASVKARVRNILKTGFS